MKEFVILALLFPFIGCNVNSVENFLSDFEYSQNVKSIIIIKIGKSTCNDKIIKTLRLPKIVFEHDKNINYLNLRKVDM